MHYIPYMLLFSLSIYRERVIERDRGGNVWDIAHLAEIYIYILREREREKMNF